MENRFNQRFYFNEIKARAQPIFCDDNDTLRFMDQSDKHSLTLSNMEKEQIRALSQEHGNSLANMKLLEILMTKNCWLSRTLDILRDPDLGQEHVADDMETAKAEVDNDVAKAMSSFRFEDNYEGSIGSSLENRFKRFYSNEIQIRVQDSFEKDVPTDNFLVESYKHTLPLSEREKDQIRAVLKASGNYSANMKLLDTLTTKKCWYSRTVATLRDPDVGCGWVADKLTSAKVHVDQELAEVMFAFLEKLRVQQNRLQYSAEIKVKDSVSVNNNHMCTSGEADDEQTGNFDTSSDIKQMDCSPPSSDVRLSRERKASIKIDGYRIPVVVPIQGHHYFRPLSTIFVPESGDYELSLSWQKKGAGNVEMVLRVYEANGELKERLPISQERPNEGRTVSLVGGGFLMAVARNESNQCEIHDVVLKLDMK